MFMEREMVLVEYSSVYVSLSMGVESHYGAVGRISRYGGWRRGSAAMWVGEG